MMIEEIKRLLPSPMDNYAKIAEKVSEIRGKTIAWRTVMYYLTGKSVGLTEGTGELIESVALDLVETTALENLKKVDKLRAERAAA